MAPKRRTATLLLAALAIAAGTLAATGAAAGGLGPRATGRVAISLTIPPRPAPAMPRALALNAGPEATLPLCLRAGAMAGYRLHVTGSGVAGAFRLGADRSGARDYRVTLRDRSGVRHDLAPAETSQSLPAGGACDPAMAPALLVAAIAEPVAAPPLAGALTLLILPE